jgi:broad specificity phosphatase PhoE
VSSSARRQGPTLVLVRHGETEWSATAKHTSVTDVPLTDAGRADAERLRARLTGREFALVLTSPRSRARETCAIAGLGDRADVNEDLAEWSYGEYEGRRTVDIREQRPGWNLWTDGTPGGESPEQVGARADRVIERALAAGGDVALFAHGHFLRVLTARWIEQPTVLGGHIALHTGAYCELGYERDRRAIWLWNDTSHLLH